MRIGTAAGTDLAPISVGPAGLLKRGSRKLLRDTPEFLVATPPKLDALSLPAPLGDRTGSGQRLDAAGSREAITMIAELDQQTWSQEVAGPG